MTDTTDTERATRLMEALDREGRADDAAVVRSLMRGLGMSLPVPDGRVRAPQNLDRWPDSLSQEDVETLLDERCGCAGRHDCNCVSVINQTRADAWYEHNSTLSGARP